MSRALRVVRSPTSAVPREVALARFRTTRERAAVASCNYWVFEEPATDAAGSAAAETGTWVEFYEARDPDTLRLALRQLQPDASPDPILRAVELD